MTTVIAFDVYGTLVDPLAIAAALGPWCGAQSQLVATIWRQQQLEYTWRRSAMGRYVDFAIVTAQALQAALADARCYVSSADQQQICQLYTQLPADPHAITALQSLRSTGFRCVAFSNATPGMLSTLLNTNGIAQHLDAIISLHEVRRYKPHPDAYHFLAQHCQTRRDNCWLVSSNSWDVLGAIHAGLHGIWVRPDGTPNEPWEFAPDVSLPDFPTLVDYARINIR